LAESADGEREQPAVDRRYGVAVVARGIEACLGQKSRAGTLQDDLGPASRAPDQPNFPFDHPEDPRGSRARTEGALSFAEPHMLGAVAQDRRHGGELGLPADEPRPIQGVHMIQIIRAFR